MRKVIYNGRTESYKSCSEPDALETGRVYEVINERKGMWQTNYILKDVEGEFNSVWFDNVNTYFAVSNEVPKKGERYKCYKLVYKQGVFITHAIKTSMVVSVEVIGKNTYEVTTVHTMYLVKVS